MSGVVLNWRKETSSFESFLSEQPGVLHVVGADPHHARHFLDSALPRLGGTSRRSDIDSLDGCTSPLEVLARLARALQVPRPPAPDPLSGDLTVASDIRARRDVIIENITVEQNYIFSQNEAGDAGALRDTIADYLATKPSFDGLVLVFLDCHEWDAGSRRNFYRHVWLDLLDGIHALGARVVFQYMPNIDQNPGAIPPKATRVIRLPSTLTAGVVPDIAAHALDQGWETSPDLASHTAKTLLGISNSVQDVYGHMLTLHNKAVSGN